MTKRESIAQLFQAYGAVAVDRAQIYVADLEEHGARWTDLEVQAACARARQRWKHASLPPVGVILAACHEIREEDQRHAWGKRQREDLRIDPDWVAANERAHCKLIRELYDAGLDFCDLTGLWKAAGKTVHLGPDDVRCKRVLIEETQAAVDALHAGKLVGNPDVAARRARIKARSEPARREPRAVRSKRLTLVSDEQAKVFN